MRLAVVGDAPWNEPPTPSPAQRSTCRSSTLAAGRAPAAALQREPVRRRRSATPALGRPMAEIAAGAGDRARRGARPARRARAERLRPVARRRLRDRRQRRRQPEQHAPRRGADAREGLGEPARGGDAGRGGLRGARQRAATPDLLRRGVGATTREFTAASSPVPARRRRNAEFGRARRTGREDERRRRDPALARGRGSRRRVRPARAARSCPLYDAMARGTTVRHVLARHEQGAGHMAEGYARASGRVGVAFATSGPGRDEPRHADRRRVDGLDPARLHHRPGALEPDRHRRLPGVRHHRDHDPDRQALVARAGRRASSRTS